MRHLDIFFLAADDARNLKRVISQSYREVAGLLYSNFFEKLPDPMQSHADAFCIAASRGDPSKQYLYGLTLLRKDPPDRGQALMWLLLAEGQGVSQAGEVAERVIKKMDVGEITQAKEMAERWQPDQADCAQN